MHDTTADQMKLITIDVFKCVKCRACAQVCPMGIIEISAEGYPAPDDDAYRLCINCGYCVDVCAHYALSHKVRARTPDSGAAIKRFEELRKRRK